MSLTESDLKALREMCREVIAEVLAGIDARRAEDEPFTPEAEREILERMASNEPGIPHDEAMRQVFGEENS